MSCYRVAGEPRPRRQTIARAASIGYAILLAGLLLAVDPFGMLGASGTPLQAASKTTPGSMLQHMTAYILLPPLLYAADWIKQARMTAAIAIAMIHGTILEGLQYFVPGRYADWYDVLANAVGVAIGAAAVALFVETGRADRPRGRVVRDA